MSSLGNILPQEWRNRLANENLKTGAVIRIHVQDTVPPKIKILIIAGIDQDKVLLATLFINTDINPNVLNTPALQQLQYQLTAASCPYLTHDSYADCSQLRERNVEEITDLLKKQPSAHLGQLSDVHLNDIKALIKSAKTISIRLKKKYGLFF